MKSSIGSRLDSERELPIGLWDFKEDCDFHAGINLHVSVLMRLLTVSKCPIHGSTQLTFSSHCQYCVRPGSEIYGISQGVRQRIPVFKVVILRILGLYSCKTRKGGREQTRDSRLS